MVRRVVDEGLVGPSRSVQAGIRGSLTAKSDAAIPAELGFDLQRGARGVRALTGLDFRGFDCVDVSPPYDPSGVTAFPSANACFEMPSLLALHR